MHVRRGLVALVVTLVALVTPLVPGAPALDAAIRLTVNGEIRQDARISEMVHGVEALLAHLRTLYRPGPGDIVMTGTPAGVGPVGPGDRLEGRLDGAPPVILRIA